MAQIGCAASFSDGAQEGPISSPHYFIDRDPKVCFFSTESGGGDTYGQFSAAFFGDGRVRFDRYDGPPTIVSASWESHLTQSELNQMESDLIAARLWEFDPESPDVKQARESRTMICADCGWIRFSVALARRSAQGPKASEKVSTGFMLEGVVFVSPGEKDLPAIQALSRLNRLVTDTFRRATKVL